MTQFARPAATRNPTVTGTVAIRKVGFDAPWLWLAAGWQDLWATPHISLAYGACFSVLAYVFAFELIQFNSLPLLLPLAGGFLLLGPLLAVGLYDISRKRELGEAIRFRDVLLAGRGARGQLMFLGVILLILYFFWIMLAFLLFMLFFGESDFPPVQDFVQTLLFTRHGIGLLVAGTAAGALLAGVSFAISAISAPMLLDRRIDAITAIIASAESVAMNPAAMALWGALIAALIAVGIAALFVGLAITFPLIGHATWHAYSALSGK